jgi:magnesium chelatase family protein
LDRIDLHVEVTPVSYDELAGMERTGDPSKTIAERVVQARKIQETRYEKYPQIYCNAQIPSRMVREVCQVNQAGLLLVKKAMEKLQLSARAYDRILKVARTAADLSGSQEIKIEHLAEAIHFRSLDREGWAA